MFVGGLILVEKGLLMKHVDLIASAILALLVITSPVAVNRIFVRNQTVMKTLIFEGETRTYWLYVPLGYNGCRPVPLLVMLHGAGGNGNAANGMSGWSILAESKGFISVFPDGVAGSWNIYDWNGTGRDDAGFLMAVINKIKEDYLIDNSRIYMTGHSMGAGMTITFAFRYASVITAIAPASGPWLNSTQYYKINPYKVPQPNAPIPVYIWRGENEFWPSAEENRLQIQYWVGLNKDNETPHTVTQGLYETEIYSEGNAEVRYTEIKNRGHDTYYHETASKIWYEFFKNLSRNSTT
jgi:poly(3-hydroxybutyrate) depolymerase